MRREYSLLHAEVSVDDRLSGLPCAALLFWTWLSTQTDAWGCITSNPSRLNAQVWPQLGKTAEETAEARDACVRAGILELHQVDGVEFLAYPRDDWDRTWAKRTPEAMRGKNPPMKPTPASRVHLTGKGKRRPKASQAAATPAATCSTRPNAPQSTSEYSQVLASTSEQSRVLAGTREYLPEREKEKENREERPSVSRSASAASPVESGLDPHAPVQVEPIADRQSPPGESAPAPAEDAARPPEALPPVQEPLQAAATQVDPAPSPATAEPVPDGVLFAAGEASDPEGKPKRTRKPPTGPHAELIAWFVEVFRERTKSILNPEGVEYPFQAGRDGKAVQVMLKAVRNDVGKAKVVMQRVMDSPFWNERGFDLSKIASQFASYAVAKPGSAPRSSSSTPRRADGTRPGEYPQPDKGMPRIIHAAG